MCVSYILSWYKESHHEFPSFVYVHVLSQDSVFLLPLNKADCDFLWMAGMMALSLARGALPGSTWLSEDNSQVRNLCLFFYVLPMPAFLNALGSPQPQHLGLPSSFPAVCLTFTPTEMPCCPLLSSILFLWAAAQVWQLDCPVVFLINSNKIVLVFLFESI